MREENFNLFNCFIYLIAKVLKIMICSCHFSRPFTSKTLNSYIINYSYCAKMLRMRVLGLPFWWIFYTKTPKFLYYSSFRSLLSLLFISSLRCLLYTYKLIGSIFYIRNSKTYDDGIVQVIRWD